MGKAKYALVTAIPMVFVGITTLSAGVLSIQNIFWPLTRKPDMQSHITGYLDSILMVVFIAGVVLVVFGAAKRCWGTLHGEDIPREAFGPPRLAPSGGGIPPRCC